MNREILSRILKESNDGNRRPFSDTQKTSPQLCRFNLLTWRLLPARSSLCEKKLRMENSTGMSAKSNSKNHIFKRERTSLLGRFFTTIVYWKKITNVTMYLRRKHVHASKRFSISMRPLNYSFATRLKTDKFQH